MTDSIMGLAAVKLCRSSSFEGRIDTDHGSLRLFLQMIGSLGSQLQGEEGLEWQREAAGLLRDVVSHDPSDQSRDRLASTLGNLAWSLILNHQFADAEQRCEEAQTLVGEIGNGIQQSERDQLIFIQGNLAHALLFQGKYDTALAIYRQYWDRPLNGKTFGEVVLEDLAELEKAGVTTADLSRITKALETLNSKARSQ